MPKPIRCNTSTERPVDTAQLQASTATIPTYAAVGDEDEHPNSSLIYFPPSDPFESEDEAEVPTASMAFPEPRHCYCCYLSQKIQVLWPKEEWNNFSQRQPSHPTSKKQAIATGKRVFVERKIVKYRLDVDSPGYQVVQLYQSDKFRFYGTVAGKPPNSKLYKLQLDLLPSDSNEILVVRKDITVLARRRATL